MDSAPLVTALLILLALAAGTALGLWLGSRRTRHTVAQLSAELTAQHTRETQLAVDRARLDAAASAQETREELAGALSRAEGLEQQVRELDRARRERLANDEKQHQLLRSLAPMQESLTKLEHTLTELEGQRAKQHGQISEQLRVAARAEEKLRGTAETLAAALRSGNARGQWGEMQLKRVVEAAGMIKGVDFAEQPSFRSENTVARPDLVVHIPGDKFLAIDAKVPIDKYLQALQAREQGDATAARQLLSQHAKSVRGHIDTLSQRDYPAALGNSPQLVVAFMPSEALLSAAFDADHSLLDYAFARGVALASPTTLLSLLKTVAHTWQQEALTSEAQHLFELSRALHKRLGTAAGHIEQLGKSIQRNVEHYNKMVGSFERSVFPTARKIAELNGDELLASPAPIEHTTRQLTAPEFSQDPDPAD